MLIPRIFRDIEIAAIRNVRLLVLKNTSFIKPHLPANLRTEILRMSHKNRRREYAGVFFYFVFNLIYPRTEHFFTQLCARVRVLFLLFHFMKYILYRKMVFYKSDTLCRLFDLKRVVLELWVCVCVCVRAIDEWKNKKGQQKFGWKYYEFPSVKTNLYTTQMHKCTLCAFFNAKKWTQARQEQIYETFSYPVCRHWNSFPEYLSVVRLNRRLKEYNERLYLRDFIYRTRR